MGRYYTCCTDVGSHSCNHKFWFGIQNSDAPQRWLKEGYHADAFSCPFAEPDAFGSAVRWDGADWPDWSERGDWDEQKKTWSGWDEDDNQVYEEHKLCYANTDTFCQPTGIVFRFEEDEVPWITGELKTLYDTFGPTARAYVDYCQLEASACYDDSTVRVEDDKEWTRLAAEVDAAYPDTKVLVGSSPHTNIWSDMADWVLGRHIVDLMEHFKCGVDLDCEI